MKNYYSKIDNSLLCSHATKEDATRSRTDISSPEEILQVSVRLLDAKTHVRPHKHIPIKKTTIGTQEAWVVIEGQILARIYDTDDQLLKELSLKSGDLMVFFRGGHELLATEDTIFYELKTGPYYGYENDKESIN